MRPEGGKRSQDTGFLVPLKVKVAPKADHKAPPLPFMLRGEQWVCDFGNPSVVRLSILDLASFRTDGRVRVDDGHAAPAALLPAQLKVYSDRTDEALKALTNSDLRPAGYTTPLGQQLAFSSTGVFKHIHSPVFEKTKAEQVDGKRIDRPKRATWRLRRCGRVRMPYAAALLDLYTMSRQAFDLDFMSSGLDATSAGENSIQPPATESSAEAADQPIADVPTKAKPDTLQIRWRLPCAGFGEANSPAVVVPRPPKGNTATFCTWRKRYGGMEVSHARRLKALEEENARLKRLLAEQMLDPATLREALGKNF